MRYRCRTSALISASYSPARHHRTMRNHG